MQAGYKFTIRQSDGTRVVKEVKPRTDAVVLAPDVREYFPDSESVNTALRLLIKLIPEKRDERAKRAGGAETPLPSASRSRSRRAGTKT
jgi:redox-regulated HSP33 family molecular chaperone